MFPLRSSSITIPVKGASSQPVFLLFTRLQMRSFIFCTVFSRSFASSIGSSLHWLLASLHGHRSARFWYEGSQRMKKREKEKARGESWEGESAREGGPREREEGRICTLICSSGEVNEKSAALHQIKCIASVPPPLNFSTPNLFERLIFACSSQTT